MIKQIWKRYRDGINYWLKYDSSSKKFMMFEQGVQMVKNKNEADFANKIGEFKTEENANKFFEDIKKKTE